MTRKIVMALDLGTTFVKAAFVDDLGVMLVTASSLAPAIDCHGRFDADCYFDVVLRVISDIVSSDPDAASQVLGLAIASQRATMIPLDDSGKAVAKAQSWTSTDCAVANDAFIRQFGHERFSFITGLIPSPIYTLAKVLNFMTSEKETKNRVSRFALLHDYVLRNLGADQFTIDPSNASATGLFDVHTGRWSSEITDQLTIEDYALADIQFAGTVVGATSDEIEEKTGLPRGISLIVGGGDQQCAALGAGAHSLGCAVLSTGTASSVMVPIDVCPNAPIPGLLIGAHIIPGLGLLEGFQSSFGSLTSWAAHLLGVEHGNALEDMARQCKAGAEGVIFYPFLSGIGSPDFEPLARATVSGFTAGAGRKHFARAVFEGIAMETRRIVETIEKHSTINRLRVAGGMSNSSFFVNLLAQFCCRDLEVSELNEAALVGAAAIALCGIGHFPSISVAARALDQGARKVHAETQDAALINHLYETYVDGILAIKKQAAQRS